MLLLRSMTFPTVALSFSALYVAAQKVPCVVELGSLALWAMLSFVLVVAIVGKRQKS